MEEASDRATVQLSELTNKYSEAQRNAQKAMALFKAKGKEKDVGKWTRTWTWRSVRSRNCLL
jgi:hypothetical protein